MRKIKLTTAFKKDYRRAKANPRHAQDVRMLYESVSLLLAQDKTLPERFQAHSLTGNWQGYRECHLKPDLLLIYRQEGTDMLQVVRLGSHSELFG